MKAAVLMDALDVLQAVSVMQDGQPLPPEVRTDASIVAKLVLAELRKVVIDVAVPVPHFTPVADWSAA